MTGISVATISSDQKNQKPIGTSFWRFNSMRLQLCILLCMNYFILAHMRHSLGMAMVCMVNSTAVGLLAETATTNALRSNLSRSDGSCPITSQLRRDYEGEFVWTTSQQGMLFAALYWGSLSSFPAGWIADRYSSKHVLTIALVINVAGSALTPIAAEYGDYLALFAVRCLMGAGQGLLVPAVSAFISRWIPPNERSTVISIYTAGNQLAGIAGMPIGAWLCRVKTVFGGWQLIFFSASVFGFFCSIIWSIGVTNGPEKNRRLSAAEKAFILASTHSQNVQSSKKGKSIPWRSLISSLPVWACIVCNFVDGLLTATLSSYLPTYFMEVLHLGLLANGLYSAAPSAVQAVLKFIMAAMADKLKGRHGISHTNISKVFNTIGFIGPAIFLFACSFLTCQHGILAVVFLCLALGLFAGTAPGFMTSQVALAPAFAGTVSAAATAAFQIGSILAPYFIGAVTTHGTRQEWQIVFTTISVLLLIAGVFFLLFGSADMQTWAKNSAQCTERQVSVPDVAAEAVLTDQKSFGQAALDAKNDAISSLDILPATAIALHS